jgi:oligopeptide transport system substrate-binding protein
MRWAWAFLFLFGCSGGERPLLFNLGVENVQLDWNRAIDSTSAVVLDNIMEGLTTYADSLQGSRAELMRPMPGLAASWSVSNEGKVYRFLLKKNVHWTDGVELEARHFVDSWERLLSHGSPNAYHLFEIENAQDFSEGREKEFGRVGVKALDRYTLEVRLRRPAPYFLHLVASASTFPVRRDLLEKFGAQWTEPEKLVTLGPYRIREWVQGDRIALTAFADYHGAAPAISEVICRLIVEPLTALALYENGGLDILPRDLPAAFLQRLRGGLDFRTGPKLQVAYLLFNVHRAPFDRVENRRAFIRAANREQLAALFPGTQTATGGWIPPGLLGYREGAGLPAAGESSDRLANRAVEVRYSGSDNWNLVFQALQRQAAEKLRLSLKLTHLEGPAYRELLGQLQNPRPAKGEPAPHLLQLSWVADYPDPHSFMNVFTSASESNYMRWRSAAYDRLVTGAFSTSDENSRALLYGEAQRLLLEEEAAVMPLFFTSHQALVRPILRGVQLNVLDKWYFRNLSFESEGWRSFGRSFLRRIRGRPGA